MKLFDADRLERLASVLHASPRQLVVLAARLARVENFDESRGARALQAAQAPGEAAETSAMLMMTPIASFAQDDLAGALALSASSCRRDEE